MVIIVLLYIKYNIILLFPFFTVLLGFFFLKKKIVMNYVVKIC